MLLAGFVFAFFDDDVTDLRNDRKLEHLLSFGKKPFSDRPALVANQFPSARPFFFACYKLLLLGLAAQKVEM